MSLGWWGYHRPLHFSIRYFSTCIHTYLECDQAWPFHLLSWILNNVFCHYSIRKWEEARRKLVLNCKAYSIRQRERDRQIGREKETHFFFLLCNRKWKILNFLVSIIFFVNQKQIKQSQKNANVFCISCIECKKNWIYNVHILYLFILDDSR